MLRNLVVLMLWCLLPSLTLAVTDPPWVERLGAIPIQDGGRVMPLDTYARSLAVQLTGRTRWSAGSGPEGFAGKSAVELLCDLTFAGPDVIHKPLIIIESANFKQHAGLDPRQRFFSAIQLGGCKGIEEMLREHMMAKSTDPDVHPTKDQSLALEIQGDLERLASLVERPQFPIVSQGPGKAFLRVGPDRGEPGTEAVSKAMAAFGRAYSRSENVEAAADELIRAINAAGVPDPSTTNRVGMELRYNKYNPWILAAIAYALSLCFFGVSRLVMKRALTALGVAVAIAGVVVHAAGVGMRVVILDRAPVSNTYEALLWMGLVGIALSVVAQMVNRKAWYFVAGLGVALLSVLFANLVPLDSQTNSLPAVLRSNYWLIVHVLTITASYGVLAVAAILGHAYLMKVVLFSREAPASGRLSHPLIAQMYRCMQVGLVLLTAGTILGGVWAADSWGRFWGWDPKETWALVSIVVYFIILHARYLGWIRDFGMAASAVLSFASIVWTFYGVNYLMASGLHSYGFGQGGGTWVGVYAVTEFLFVLACWLRLKSLRARANRLPRVAPAPQAASGNVQADARGAVQGA